MPSREDFFRSAQNFEKWWKANGKPLESLPSSVHIDFIRGYLSKFLLIGCGIIEFNKFKLVDRYIAEDPPIVDDDVFRILRASLKSLDFTEDEARTLLRFAKRIEAEMNDHLGFCV